jgi:integrase
MKTEKVKMKRVFNTLTDDEITTVINMTGTYAGKVLLQLAVSTGIRREDISAIEISKIDLRYRVISFWQEKKDREHRVPIDLALVPELERYINTLPRGCRWLFPSPKLGPKHHITGRQFWNQLQSILARAGIKKHMRFHDLRATCAKYWRRRGLGDCEIADLLDDELETVKEYYEQYTAEEIRDRMDAVRKSPICKAGQE